ncbi:hypothetical protein [Actinophytocola sediminis]
MVRALRATDPRQVGPYRVLAELGHGGMGRVLLGSGPGGLLATGHTDRTVRLWRLPSR